MPFGRFFEDFDVGTTYKHWPGRTITEYDDTLFCMLTMNHNPLHIDERYAASTQHGKRLVVGALIFSIALGMSVPDISGRAIANLEFESVRHTGPTFHGDTVYAETTILEKRLSRSKPDRGIVKVATRAVNQDGVEVLTFRRSVLVPCRGHEQGIGWPASDEPQHQPTQPPDSATD